MKTTLQFLGMFLIASAIAALAYTSYMGMLVYQVAERNEAVDECLKVSSKTWSEVNPSDRSLINTTTEPNLYWVRLCMQEKGITFQTELK